MTDLKMEEKTEYIECHPTQQEIQALMKMLHSAAEKAFEEKRNLQLGIRPESIGKH